MTCASEDDEIVWTDVVDGTVCAVTGNSVFSAVAVTDGFVVLYVVLFERGHFYYFNNSALSKIRKLTPSLTQTTGTVLRVVD